MRRRVLVVDDDAMIRDALSLVLGERHEVTLADSVAQARAALAGGGAGYDVVVCDLQLADGDARSVWRAFGERRGFVVMTGGAGDEALGAFLRASAHVLEKPFDFDEALALIERVAAK